MSTFWFVDVSVCRRFGLSTFRFVDVSVCRHFGLSTFWFVDVSVCRRFGLSTFWLSTFRFVDVLTSNHCSASYVQRYRGSSACFLNTLPWKVNRIIVDLFEYRPQHQHYQHQPHQELLSIFDISLYWNACSRNKIHGQPVTGEFPAQRASNAENVSIWWRHHGCWFSWREFSGDKYIYNCTGSLSI